VAGTVPIFGAIITDVASFTLQLKVLDFPEVIVAGVALNDSIVGNTATTGRVVSYTLVGSSVAVPGVGTLDEPGMVTLMQPTAEMGIREIRRIERTTYHEHLYINAPPPNVV
jgi:hypothetical protein